MSTQHSWNKIWTRLSPLQNFESTLPFKRKKKKDWWIINNLKNSSPLHPPTPSHDNGFVFQMVRAFPGPLVEFPFLSLPPPPKLLNFGLPFRKTTTSLDVFSSSLFIKLPFHCLIFYQSPMILSSTQSSCQHLLTMAVQITEKSNNRITDSKSLLNPFTPRSH